MVKVFNSFIFSFLFAVQKYKGTFFLSLEDYLTAVDSN